MGAINLHYTPFLSQLCSDPAAAFHDRARMGAALPAMPLVEDPIRYAGGPLLHTRPIDPVMKAIRSLANAVEQLAASHGALLDADPAARERVEGRRAEGRAGHPLSGLAAPPSRAAIAARWTQRFDPASLPAARGRRPGRGGDADLHLHGRGPR